MTLSEGDAAPQAAMTQQETPVDAKRAPYGLDDLMALDVTTGAVSPAMARHMRDSMHYERQRPIDVRNVERLSEELKRGWFMPGTPIFICVLPDGRQFIVNGNHTLEAVAASGVTIPLTLIRRRVRVLDEVATAYATFDLQKVRTWRDTLQAAGMTDRVPHANNVFAALGVIVAGFRQHTLDKFTTQSRQLRLQLLPDYENAAHVIGHAINLAPNAGQRVVLRAAFMAVALFTARYQPSLAIEFWGGLAKDDGLKANDPRKALLRYAGNNTASGTSSRNTHARAAALAWNAFFEGRTLEYCKPNAAPDLKILGTPLHKGAAE